MIKNRISLSLTLLAAICMVGVVSCKKYYDPPPVFEKYGNDSTELQRKVLIISVDGVSGRALKEINPPNIAQLMEHGKYSFDVKASTTSTSASGWVTMMTGIPYSKHGISDSTFIYNPGDFDEDANIPYYPPALQYLQPIKTRMNIAFVTPWDELADYMGFLGTNSVAVQNDERVKDTTISMLKSLNSLGVMVVDLHDADVAGSKGLYSLADFDYRNAIKTDDQYIGDIIHALKSRENYENEDWLVMVTTNHAGSPDNPKKGFVVLSNPRLNKEEVHQTGFNTVHFAGDADDPVYATVPDDQGLYNFGTDQDFTIQMQVEFNVSKKWPGFFGKTDGLSGSTITGFVYMQSGEVWAPVFGGTANGGSGKNQINTSKSISNMRWHTLTMSVKMENGTRTARLYVDGNFSTSKDITSQGNLNTEAPLTLGYINVDGWGTTDFYASGIEVFDVALDSATVADNYDLTDITAHPDYDDLIGFWQVNEGGGPILYNSAPKGYNMELHGPYEWVGLGDDFPPSIESSGGSERPSVVPQPTDVMMNMFYWLNVEPNSDWNLEGNPWLDNYEDEIYEL